MPDGLDDLYAALADAPPETLDSSGADAGDPLDALHEALDASDARIAARTEGNARSNTPSRLRFLGASAEGAKKKAGAARVDAGKPDLYAMNRALLRAADSFVPGIEQSVYGVSDVGKAVVRGTLNLPQQITDAAVGAVALGANVAGKVGGDLEAVDRRNRRIAGEEAARGVGFSWPSLSPSAAADPRVQEFEARKRLARQQGQNAPTTLGSAAGFLKEVGPEAVSAYEVHPLVQGADAIASGAEAPALAPSEMSSQRSIANPIKWLESAGENLPQIAVQMAMSAIPGYAETKLGRMVMFAMGAAPMEYSDALQAQVRGVLSREPGLSMEEALIKAAPMAARTAAVNTALEGVSGAGILGEGKSYVGKAARAFVSEGSTETAQEASSVFFENEGGVPGSDDPTSIRDRLVLSGITGGILGGGAGLVEHALYPGERGSASIDKELAQRDIVQRIADKPSLPPKVPGRGTPSPLLRDIADRYVQRNASALGFAPASVADDSPPTVNEDLAKRVADAYQAATHNPSDPEVAAAYDALKAEIEAQRQHFVNEGIKFTPFQSTPENPQPYKNSAELSRRVNDERELFFFTGGEMPADHPLAEINPNTGNTYNDDLRGVHDAAGHVVNGNEFGPRGETAAARDHVKMFSPLARRALLTETLGQNSWVNYGPHLRDESGNIPSRGQPGYVSPVDRPFAEQKATLLPSELVDEFLGVPAPQTRELWHVSATDRAELDPEFQGTGSQGTESRHGGGPKAVFTYSVHPESPQVANDFGIVTSKMKGDGQRSVHKIEGQFRTLNADSEEGAALLDQWEAEHAKMVKPANRAEGGFDLPPLRAYLAQRAVDAGYDSIESGGIMKVFRKIGGHEIVSRGPDAGPRPVRKAAVSNVLVGHGRPGWRPGGGINPIHEVIELARKAGLGRHVASGLRPEELKGMGSKLADTINRVYGELPSDATYRALAKAGLEKRGWYRRAAITLKAMFGTDTKRFVAVLAAQSPQQPVDQNLRMTFRTWKLWNDAGRPTDEKSIRRILSSVPGAIMEGRAQNTVRSLSGKDVPDLSGFKVDSFFHNLQGHLDRVTNDTWMAIVGGFSGSMFGKKSHYLASTAKVRNVAKQLSMEPAEVQETVWSFAKVLAEAMGRNRDAKAAVNDAMLRVPDAPEFATLLLDDPEIVHELKRLGLEETLRSFLLEQRREREAGARKAQPGLEKGDTELLAGFAQRIPEGSRKPTKQKGFSEGAAVLHGGSIFDQMIVKMEATGRDKIAAAKKAIDAEIARSRATMGTAHVSGKLIAANLKLAAGVAQVAAAKGLRKTGEISAMVREALGKSKGKTDEKLVTDLVRGVLARGMGPRGEYRLDVISKEAGKMERRAARAAKTEAKAADEALAEQKVQGRIAGAVADATGKTVTNPSGIAVPGVPGKRTDQKTITEGEALAGSMKKAESAARAGFVAGRQQGVVEGSGSTAARMTREGTRLVKSASGVIVPGVARSRRDPKMYTDKEALEGSLKREVRAAEAATRQAVAAQRKRAKEAIVRMVAKYKAGELVSGFSAEKALKLVKRMLPRNLHSKYTAALAGDTSDRGIYRVLQRAQRDYTLMVGRGYGRELKRVGTKKSLSILSSDDQKLARSIIDSTATPAALVSKPKGATPAQIRDAVQALADAHAKVVGVLTDERNSRKVRIGEKVVETQTAIETILGTVKAFKELPQDRRNKPGGPRASIAKQALNANLDMRTRAAIRFDNDPSGEGVASKLVDRVAEANKKHIGQRRADTKIVAQEVQAAGYKSLAHALVETSGTLGQRTQKYSKHEVTSMGGNAVKVDFSLGEKLAVYAMDPDTIEHLHRAEGAVNEAEDGIDAEDYDNADDYDKALTDALSEAKGAKSTPVAFRRDGVGGKNYVLTNAQRLAIVNTLTSAQKKMVDRIKELLLDGPRQAEFFEAIRKLKGTLPERVEQYFTRERKSSLTPQPTKEIGWKGLKQRLLENTTLAESRAFNPNDPILISDFFERLNRTLDDSSLAIHLAEPIRDASLVLQDMEVREAVNQRHGNGESKFTDSYMEAASHSIPDTAKIVDIVVRGVATMVQRAHIGLNPGSLAKNLASGSWRLRTVMPPSDVLWATKPSLPAHQAYLSQLVDRSDYLWHRNAGDPARIFVGSDVIATAFDRAGFAKATGATVGNIVALAKSIARPSTLLYRGADLHKSVTQMVRSVRAYAWVEHKTSMIAMDAALRGAKRDMPGATKAEIEAEAIKRAEAAIARTQASWDADRMSGVQHVQTRSTLAYLAAPYQADPARVFNIAYVASKGKWSKFLRVMTEMAVAAALSALIGAGLSKDAFSLYGNMIGDGLNNAQRAKAQSGVLRNSAMTALNETIGNEFWTGRLVGAATQAASTGVMHNPMDDNPTFSAAEQFSRGVWDMGAGLIEEAVSSRRKTSKQLVGMERFYRGLSTAGGQAFGVWTGLGPIYTRGKAFYEGLDPEQWLK